MSNNTETFWSAADASGTHHSLHTYAHSIATLGGDAMAPRPLRGGNLLIPHAPGERRMPKQVDAFTLSLVMWIIGANEDGTIPPAAIEKFRQNWRHLRSLLWRPNEEFELQKRFYDDDGVLRSPIAMAEYYSGLDPTMTGAARAGFVVDLRLADPFFYEPQQSKILATGHQTVTNAGDAPTQRVIVRAQGARGAFTVHNHTTGISLSFNDSLATGQTVNLDVKAHTAKNQSGINMISSVTHAGASAWMELASGDNDIELISSGSGTGTVTLIHQNAWL